MTTDRLIIASREMMARAAHYARAAAAAKRNDDCDVVPGLLALSRRAMTAAKRAYRYALAKAVRAGELAHKYARRGAAWLAVVTVGDAIAWTGSREYGRRQSAQRAALAKLGKLTREHA